MPINSRNQRANALVVVLGMLFIVSALVVTFAKLSTGEMVASGNFASKTGARFLSLAGTQQALAKLRADFSTHMYCSLEKFVANPDEKQVTPADWCYRASSGIGQEDNIGDGVSLVAMQTSTSNYAHPSYQAENLLHGRKISGSLGVNEAFTLKIFDTNSQLDLNSQVVPTDEDGNPVATPAVPLAVVLNHLSEAIAEREQYREAFPGDDKGPFFSTESAKFLGEDIIARREEMGGFSNKLDLLQIEGIDPVKFSFALDYITVYSPKRAVIARNEKFANEQEAYRADSRAPVNINTASWPVLVAIFRGVSAIAPDDPTRAITISKNEAKALANRICRDRISSPFTFWEGFKTYLLENKDIFTGSAMDKEEKAYLLYANADPNVVLRRWNVDSPAWQPINKTDQTFYTTEFCFYPHGVFEITSLGQIFSDQGNIAAEAQTCTIARAFSLMHKTTQLDFQSAQVVSDLQNPQLAYSEKYQLNATSHINNLMMQPQHQESILFGHVQPVIADYQYGVKELDLPVADGGNLLFKANFNKTLDADVADGRSSLETVEQDITLSAQPIIEQARQIDMSSAVTELDFTNKSKIFPIAPNVNDTSTNFLYGDIAPDGIIFWEDKRHPERANNALCYQSNDNFPNPSRPGEEEGTLMFWFKLNENMASAYRTVFFNTTVIDPPSLGIERGIQMEVKMKYNSDTGTLNIFAHRRFYSTAPIRNDETCPFENVCTTVETMYSPDDNYGIKAHEWYHVAIRWRNGTDMVFSKTNADAILLSGNFYGKDTSGKLEDTPTGETIALLKNVSGPVQSFALTSASCTPRDLFAIETTELGTEKGRMYIGAMARNGEAESLAMTLDDVRIVKGAQAIDDAVPSRYPEMEQFIDSAKNVFGVISKFNGTFVNKPKFPVILVGLDWTVRNASDVLKGVPFIRQENAALGYLQPAHKKTNLDEEALFGQTSTPISSWLPEEGAKPILINNKEIGTDPQERQLGVKNEVWRELYKMFLPPQARKAMSLQEFINNFGAALIVIWNLNRGSLPALQAFVNKDFAVLDGDQERTRFPVPGQEVANFADQAQNFARNLNSERVPLEARANQLKEASKQLDSRGKILQAQGNELIKRGKSTKNKQLIHHGKSLRQQGKALRQQAQEIRQRSKGLRNYVKFLQKISSFLTKRANNLRKKSKSPVAIVEGQNLQAILRAVLQGLFSFLPVQQLTTVTIIDAVNNNLRSTLPRQGLNTLGLTQLGDLFGGVHVDSIPSLGFDLQSRERDTQFFGDESGVLKIRKPGSTFKQGKNGMEVLPKWGHFDYQLRFEVEKIASDTTLAPQFSAPIVDDLTLVYQDKIEYIDQFELLLR